METEKEVKSSKGRKFLVLGVLLMMSIFTFAGVVTYLSNTVEANVDVQSPMTLTIDGGTDPVDVDVYGGEAFEFTTVGTNVSENAVDVYPTTFTLSANDPTYEWTGDEVQSINLVDRSVDKGDVLPYLYVVNDDGTQGPLFTDIASTTGDIRVMVDETPGDGVFEKYSHPAGSAIDNVIDVTFAQDITPGTYTIVAQQLFALAK